MQQYTYYNTLLPRVMASGQLYQKNSTEKKDLWMHLFFSAINVILGNSVLMLQSIFCKWQTPSSHKNHHVYFSNNLAFCSSCWASKGVYQGQVKLKAKRKESRNTMGKTFFIK